MATVISVDEAVRRTSPSQVKTLLYQELTELPIDRALVYAAPLPQSLVNTAEEVALERSVKWRVSTILDSLDGTNSMAVWFEER